MSYIYIHILVKLAIIVEGDPKSPFSIASTPINPFPGLLHFTLDLYLIMISV